MALTDKKYKIYLLLAISGLLTGFAVIFPKIGLLAYISVIPMAAVLLMQGRDKNIKFREIYLYGVIFYYFYYLVTLHWFLFMYPLEFIDGLSPIIALAIVSLAGVGIPLLQGALGGFVFLLSALVLRSKLFERVKWLCPLFVAGAMTVFEWIQTLDWWGMPTARISMTQTEIAAGIQSASLLGSYFVTFLVLSVNLFAALAFSELLENKPSAKKTVRTASIVIVGILLLNYGFGAIYLIFGNTKERETVRVAAVQGNIDTSQKWEIESGTRIFENYEKYTLEAAEKGAEIVVLPETALPYTLSEGNSVYKYLSELAIKANVTLFAGTFTLDKEDNEYNTVVCFTPDGKMSETTYCKRHLVPFGEFVPLKEFVQKTFPPLAELIMSGSDLAEGKGANVFALEKVNVGAGICYDSMYEDVTLDAGREGAEMFITASNDSWFGGSAYFEMHNAQIKLRSVENRRYTVHAASTGTSVVISDEGRVKSQVEPYTEGIAYADVEICNDRTLYSYIGNAFIYLWIVLIVAATVYGAVTYMGKKS